MVSYQPAVLGAMLYVDTFGEDAGNLTCSKVTPCATVSHALIQSGQNGIITVGPGIYEESLTVSNDNIRIRSRHIYRHLA